MRKEQTGRGQSYTSRVRESRMSVMAVAGLIVLGIGIGLGCVGFLVYKGMARSDFFQITAIRIEGCRRITKKEILELSGVDVHSNLLALKVETVQQQIGAHAWVDRAEVKRLWPNRLQITVKERKPVALVNLKDGLHYVDQQGVIFAAPLPPDDIDFPVISGVGPEAKGMANSEALADALDFIGYASLGNAILPKQNISELRVDARGGLILFLADRPFPVHLGRERLRTKYYQLTRVLHWLYAHKRFDATASIRMDYQPDKVLVALAGMV